MAITRPMTLSDEPFDAPPQVLNNDTSPFASPSPDPAFDAPRPPLAADDGIFAATPTYANRRSGGGGYKKVAMIAIPLAVVAVAAGLVLTSPSQKAPIADQPVAANGTPAQAGVPATIAPVTPPSAPQVAEASPPLTTTPMVATPRVVTPSAVTPSRASVARSTARAATRRAAAERTAAPSAGSSAVDTSARVATTPPPVLVVPAPVIATPPPAPEPVTPPQ